MNLYSKIIEESTLKENYGDNKDYSNEIQKLFKQWFKENADRWVRATQFLTSGYDLDIEVRDMGQGSNKCKVYKVTNYSIFVDVQDYADEIGKYISDKIPALEFVKSKYIDKPLLSGDEDAGDLIFYFKQQIGIPDFGEDIMDSNIKSPTEEEYKQFSDYLAFIKDNNLTAENIVQLLHGSAKGLNKEREFLQMLNDALQTFNK